MFVIFMIIREKRPCFWEKMLKRSGNLLLSAKTGIFA